MMRKMYEWEKKSLTNHFQGQFEGADHHQHENVYVSCHLRIHFPSPSKSYYKKKNQIRNMNSKHEKYELSGPKPSKISTESVTQLHKNGAHFHFQDLPGFLITTPPISHSLTKQFLRFPKIFYFNFSIFFYMIYFGAGVSKASCSA